MRVIMTVMMIVTSLTQRDLGEGQEDGDHDGTRDDWSQYQEILTGMAEMPPSPILSSPGTTLITSRRPASERHPPAGAGETTGAGATGQGQCFGHYRAEEHNYHCFVDTMHTKILVNNEINESEKSRQYFE